MKRKELIIRLNEIGNHVASIMNNEGFWEGKLSSSALAVALAVTALHFDDYKKNSEIITKGINWLGRNINTDGSFGDTPGSPGNVSTSLIVYAALNLYAEKDDHIRKIQSQLAGYLITKEIDVKSCRIAEIILNHYQHDFTFSVPILTMCGLCGVPDKEAFKHIPQLPFELLLLPRSFYRFLNLSVVSYAIPALVAVGIVIFKNKRSNLFLRVARRLSIKKALNVLNRMLPESGGYLEAIPLTAFVNLSLINSGYRESVTVKKGIQFLKNTQREDGSWPIDINLSTWVTTLTVKAYRSNINNFLTSEQQKKVARHLIRIQNKKTHIFNGTGPGGWGWTDHEGSVPDCDDTPGAILALLNLQSSTEFKCEILAATKWLAKIQNSDGGFPTFSKGWGKLPFDQSCSDLTGHCLLSVSAVREIFQSELTTGEMKELERIFVKALNYLKKKQTAKGSFLPLWFGNQYATNFINPVYGTARVLTYLKDASIHSWINEKSYMQIQEMIGKGTRFLISVQNKDGSWGGDKNVAGSMEETALALSAIASTQNMKYYFSGLGWMDNNYHKNGFKPSPIGLYFARLWYDEKMYPIIFYLEAITRGIEVDR